MRGGCEGRRSVTEMMKVRKVDAQSSTAINDASLPQTKSLSSLAHESKNNFPAHPAPAGHVSWEELLF
jgi:hypothetical protein